MKNFVKTKNDLTEFSQKFSFVFLCQFNLKTNFSCNRFLCAKANGFHVDCTSDKMIVEHTDAFDLSMNNSLLNQFDYLNRTIENKQKHQQHNWPNQD